jgi:hypothetical protein
LRAMPMRIKRLPLFSSWRQNVPQRIEGLAAGGIGKLIYRSPRPRSALQSDGDS